MNKKRFYDTCNEMPVENDGDSCIHVIFLDHPLPAQVELAALFLIAKKKLSKEARKRSILCKKMWEIQP